MKKQKELAINKNTVHDKNTVYTPTKLIKHEEQVWLLVNVCEDKRTKNKTMKPKDHEKFIKLTLESFWVFFNIHVKHTH